MIYYPLGKCISSGANNGVLYSADNAGNVRLQPHLLPLF